MFDLLLVSFDNTHTEGSWHQDLLAGAALLEGLKMLSAGSTRTQPHNHLDHFKVCIANTTIYDEIEVRSVVVEAILLQVLAQ